MRHGGDVGVSRVRAWVAAAESEHGTAYGATFGSSHPHDFHVVAGAGLSAREAEFQAVLRVLTIVPQDLTLYVVCTPHCQLDLHMRPHAWAEITSDRRTAARSWGKTLSRPCMSGWRTGPHRCIGAHWAHHRSIADTKSYRDSYKSGWERGIHMPAAGCGRDAHSVHSLVVVQRGRKGRTERSPNIAAVRTML